MSTFEINTPAIAPVIDVAIEESSMYSIMLKLIVLNSIKSIKEGKYMEARKLMLNAVKDIGARGVSGVDDKKSERVIELFVLACQYINTGKDADAVQSLLEIGQVLTLDSAKTRYLALRESDGDLCRLPYDIREEILYSII